MLTLSFKILRSEVQNYNDDLWESWIPTLRRNKLWELKPCQNQEHKTQRLQKVEQLRMKTLGVAVISLLCKTKHLELKGVFLYSHLQTGRSHHRNAFAAKFQQGGEKRRVIQIQSIQTRWKLLFTRAAITSLHSMQHKSFSLTQKPLLPPPPSFTHRWVDQCWPKSRF